MATFYVDPEGGGFGNGLTFANRVKNCTQVTINSNDTVRYPSMRWSQAGSASTWGWETPRPAYTTSHRITGGSFISVSNMNTTTWTWSFSSNHGLAAQDYFISTGFGSYVANGIFKVTNVLNTTQVQTEVPFASNTTSTSGGYCSYANSKVFRLSSNNGISANSYVRPLAVSWPTDLGSWTAYVNSSTGWTTTQTSGAGLVKGPYAASAWIRVTGTSSLTSSNAYYNIPGSGIPMSGLPGLNWWMKFEGGNSYPRYITQNSYNNTGSGQFIIRLYDNTNLTGNYLEYEVPYYGSVSGEWYPCFANPKPNSINYSVFNVRSISLTNLYGYGTQDFYISNMWLSGGRTVVPVSSINNRAFTGVDNSINIHSVVTLGSAPSDSCYWYPVEGVTMHGDIILGTFTNQAHATTSQGFDNHAGTRGYWNFSPFFANGSTAQIGNYPLYVGQCVRRDSDYISSDDLYLSSNKNNITIRGGYTISSEMQTDDQTGCIVDSITSNTSMFAFMNTYNINVENMGSRRWFHGIYESSSFNYSNTFDRYYALDNERGWYQGGGFATAGFAGKRWGIKFKNCKFMHNLNASVGASSSAYKHIIFEGEYNSWSSNISVGLSLANTDKVECLPGTKIYASNNANVGIDAYYCAELDFEYISAHGNWSWDFRTFGCDTVHITEINCGARTWNGSLRGGSSNYYNQYPLSIFFTPVCKIGTATINSLGVGQACMVPGSSVGINNLIWYHNSIDQNFAGTPAAGVGQVGPYANVSAETITINNASQNSRVWGDRRIYMIENTNLTYSFGGSGKSYAIYPYYGCKIAPGKISIGKVPVEGGSPITISCKIWNNSSNVTPGMTIKRGSCGLTQDVVGYAASSVTGQWQDLSLTCTPVSSGVLDIQMESSSTTSPSFNTNEYYYLDSFTFS